MLRLDMVEGLRAALRRREQILELLRNTPAAIVEPPGLIGPGQPHVIARFAVPRPQPGPMLDLYLDAGKHFLIDYMGQDYYEPYIRTVILFEGEQP